MQLGNNPQFFPIDLWSPGSLADHLSERKAIKYSACYCVAWLAFTVRFVNFDRKKFEHFLKHNLCVKTPSSTEGSELSNSLMMRVFISFIPYCTELNQIELCFVEIKYHLQQMCKSSVILLTPLGRSSQISLLRLGIVICCSTSITTAVIMSHSFKYLILLLSSWFSTCKQGITDLQSIAKQTPPKNL
ncbi:hypothetical protein VP01_1907g1 [Puccinia sorghi]|uniref:Uncharacterized protein n=1 Tax=Puccinia sorghi TaxID=27349 RepID=A0A0L6VCW1_9BASI|nr:hypothetical protein VP01_1907g1 [Puccinia sorghi]